MILISRSKKNDTKVADKLVKTQVLIKRLHNFQSYKKKLYKLFFGHFDILVLPLTTISR